VAPDVGALSMRAPLRAGDAATFSALGPGADDFLIGTLLAVIAGLLLLRGREYP
jgi:hypothetical protein